VRDLLDLACVFDVRKFQIDVLSFESNRERARKAGHSIVVRTLARVPSVQIRIVHGTLAESIDRIRSIRPARPLIYFLDYTGIFMRAKAADVIALLDARLIQAGDFLLVTSNLTPRFVRQASFMAEVGEELQLLFGAAATEPEFRERNHVDYYLTEAFDGARRGIYPLRLARLRYKDTNTPMGVWLFQIETGHLHYRWPDDAFEEFPIAFAAEPKEDEIAATEEIDLFDGFLT
jgi:hypothetical protein